jgi:hypothetical protein
MFGLTRERIILPFCLKNLDTSSIPSTGMALWFIKRMPGPETGILSMPLMLNRRDISKGVVRSCNSLTNLGL